jgi:hypothetical protein
MVWVGGGEKKARCEQAKRHKEATKKRWETGRINSRRKEGNWIKMERN